MKRPFVLEFAGSPEAGKTTCIQLLKKEMKNRGYKVEIVTESAADMPKQIPKGLWVSNIWIRENMIQKFLSTFYMEPEFLLVDRGIYDSQFHGYKLLSENKCTKNEYEAYMSTYKCIPKLKADLLVVFTVDPKEAIKRRHGKEGNIVTLEYVATMNDQCKAYFETLQDEVQIQFLDTTKMDRQEVLKQILRIIQW